MSIVKRNLDTNEVTITLSQNESEILKGALGNVYGDSDAAYILINLFYQMEAEEVRDRYNFYGNSLEADAHEYDYGV